MNRASCRHLLGMVSVFLFVAGSASAANPAPKTYGTQNVTWYRVSAAEFAPANGTVPSTSWNPSSSYAFRTWGTGGWFFAAPHLPAGALLTGLELDACDTNGSGNHLDLQLYDCDRFSNCNAVPLTSVSTFDLGPGCGSVSIDVTGANYTVDNQAHQLLLWANMAATDGTNQIAGAAIGYVLQVSPAPGSPTFNDGPHERYRLSIHRSPRRLWHHGRMRRRQLLPGQPSHASADGDLPCEGARIVVLTDQAF